MAGDKPDVSGVTKFDKKKLKHAQTQEKVAKPSKAGACFGVGARAREPAGRR